VSHRSPPISVRPLTPERWHDLVTLFGCRGCSVARNCWCMAYRESGTPTPQIGKLREQRRRALRNLVEAGTVPGLLAYRSSGSEEAVPVGWISLGPREEYAKLQRSPIMKPVDDQPVWSVVCFFVHPEHRGAGVATALLNAGIRHARDHGARLLEAYPVDDTARRDDKAMWFGAKRMYDRAGFHEVARRKPTRPVVRKALRGAARHRAAASPHQSSH